MSIYVCHKSVIYELYSNTIIGALIFALFKVSLILVNFDVLIRRIPKGGRNLGKKRNKTKMSTIAFNAAAGPAAGTENFGEEAG